MIAPFLSGSSDLRQAIIATADCATAAQVHAYDLQQIAEIKSGLRRGLEDNDPGKHGLAAWFLNCQEIRSALLDCLPEGYGSKNIPEWFPVIRIADALLHPCPCCNEKRPVILTHEQTMDSYDFDTWELKLVIICGQKVHVLRYDEGPDRFGFNY